MTGVLALASLLASTVVIFVAILVVAPSLAYDRMLRDLSAARTRWKRLVESRPEVAEAADVQLLGKFVVSWSQRDRAVGLSHWLEAAMTIHRHPVPSIRPSFRGLPLDVQNELRAIERDTVHAVSRATLFGSRVWFLLLPTVLVLRYVVLPVALLLRSARTVDGTSRNEAELPPDVPDEQPTEKEVVTVVTTTTWTLEREHASGTDRHRSLRGLLSAH